MLPNYKIREKSMKGILIITAFILCPIFAFAQFNSSIDFVGGLEYSYRNLKAPSGETMLIDKIEERDSKEEGKRNWRIGINYNKRLTNRFYLKSGIRLASVGYKGETFTGLRWPEEIGPDGYMPNPELPHEIQYIYDYRFVEVPIAGRYEFASGKLSPFFEAGISPSYYLTTRTKSITDLGTSISSQRGGTSSNRDFHLVGAISIGSNYTISDNYQVFGQVAYRYHFTELYEAPISEHLYNYGMEIGIRKKID